MDRAIGGSERGIVHCRSNAFWNNGNPDGNSYLADDLAHRILLHYISIPFPHACGKRYGQLVFAYAYGRRGGWTIILADAQHADDCAGVDRASRAVHSGSDAVELWSAIPNDGLCGLAQIYNERATDYLGSNSQAIRKGDGKNVIDAE